MDFKFLDAQLFGSTYTPEQLITKLALENAYYKKQLPTSFVDDPLPVPGPREVLEAPQYQAVQDYLGLTATEAGGRRHLVLTNDYPDEGHEYANGFVHRRVKRYQSYGNAVDVASIKRRRPAGTYVYDGVAVLRGFQNELAGLLAARTYDSVSVHFLNAHMWNVLLPHLAHLDLYVYVHGYEIRHWIRSPFDQASPQDLSTAIERTQSLQAFWTRVLDAPHGPKAFFFVSDWWRRAATEDVDVSFPQGLVRIVHNVVDTDLFHYVPKPAEQRFKLLWVRSAHARSYGADLAVKCLKILRETPHWERVEARIVGRGRYFGAFSEAFSSDANVSIEERFLGQSEIAKLHREYGVFLVPTRMDTQGVSRDEAMASGLVPVTNRVAAVDEFVDDSCGVVADPEDAEAMARGIIELIEHPDLFRSKSKAAACRVRRLSAPEHTTEVEAREMGLSSEVQG